MAFDPVAWINTPRWQASRLGLERMTDLLERLGRPQDDLRFVHVAGTNGKGSVCAYLARILEEAGYTVGLFTSPYILRFEERIRVNGADITAEELARAVAVVRPAAAAIETATGDHPTEFELMAAVALEHFRASACDIVVLEVGLGGRLDATNAIDAPEVSIITRIGLDHTDLLGDTLAAVAGEKAGIVKAGVPVVSWPQEPEAMAVIEAVCAERGCELRCPDFADLAVEPLAGAGGEGVVPLRRFSYRGRPFETHLLGSYQPFNAVLALAACEELRARGWAISDGADFAGIAAARWPGRFEVADTFPLTIVDGGHNPQGAEALASSLADLLGEAGRSSVHFALGVLADKDYPAMVRAVAPWAASFSVYAPENPRALAVDELAACVREVLAEEARSGAVASRGGVVPVNICASPAAALAAARDAAGSEGVAVAFGTLYAIADLGNASGCR
ncbi:bifunctional folylpolyglutamate synthase/dihydrofolate synthase [Adlercreutzia muris]|uniref:tetrahydrofolate synthase n=1 Tax=Adlercreutzia muris TaxID=1796610 RepID=A0A7C8BWD6_9ACTN|nr:folylpolyglutamate synthase/dihydrofolate synthase family protein [Adlercreutzia muris]KAB1646646.1 bifunctional folylpolyglutamate synthase/dihydrofolate synthase [Adlercreutzia muris]MCR2029182.1 bifunctional folylpolyglutamate synthase/dihydrofolate synthase [Adlercreutzia muris]MCU7584354.1 bifunctional folylpolyglutamate synthase/dihydrofolate synthase [Adlercreutzia muris]